jgi:electron transport complex protein RnfE
MSYWKTFLKGLIKENPVLVMLLGTCPTLAVTTMALNGLGMGLATTFVLVCSNVVISLLKKFIPKEVRLPCYIVIIAGFVTFVSFILQVYVPDLYKALGVFLSLITVNCIILGRAEMFASKNNVRASFMDGLGMGLGFTGALLMMGIIRELLGSGSIFGISIGSWFEPIGFFTAPAGGFFVFGCVIALVNVLSNYKMSSKKIGCANCPNASACGQVEKGECAE